MTEELTLEKMKIVERLAGLESAVQQVIEMKKENREQLKQMHEENRAHLRDIDKTLHGNGKEGHTVRIDRLEQAVKVMTWLGGTTLACVIGLVVQQIASLIRSP